MPDCEPFDDGQTTGFLHTPEKGNGEGLLLTHGAGSNCQAPLLVAIAQVFQSAGYHVLRCDLAFRQRRKSGPPHPSHAASDRDSLRAALAAIKRLASGPVSMGGHSYGGRQASMLASEHPTLASRLLLLSYPLHPPGKPDQLRTAHWPHIQTPALFVSGDADPFGTIAEMKTALKNLAAPHSLSIIEGAGHDLKRGKFDIAARVLQPFAELARLATAQ